MRHDQDMSDERGSILRADDVAVAGKARLHGLDVLPPTSLEVSTGDVLVVVGEPGTGHMALALALAGRLDGMSGSVTLDGVADRRGLQSSVALVDVPGVSEPDAGVPVHTVVGEELAMARHAAGRGAVRRWLDGEGLAHRHAVRMAELGAGERVAMLARLAALRRPRFLVLTLPERHGGVPGDWAEVLDEITDAGMGVVVTVSPALAAQHPEARQVRIGAEEAAA